MSDIVESVMKKTLKIVRTTPVVPMPKYSIKGDAGFDLFVAHALTLKPMERASVTTGYRMEIPYGYVGIIYEKSGLSHKQGIITFGNVIDAGYRGEVKVGVINLGSETYTFEPGHKVAQMIIHGFATMKFKEVGEDDLSESERGTRGFGSTGK
jgi:dUTP pyrophosphatase